MQVEYPYSAGVPPMPGTLSISSPYPDLQTQNTLPNHWGQSTPDHARCHRPIRYQQASLHQAPGLLRQDRLKVLSSDWWLCSYMESLAEDFAIHSLRWLNPAQEVFHILLPSPEEPPGYPAVGRIHPGHPPKPQS